MRLFLLLVLHGALAATLFPSQRLRRRAFAVAAIAPAATLCWLLTRLGDVVDGDVSVERIEWVPELGLSADVRLDGLAALMVLLIGLVGVLVCAFSARYYSATSRRLGRNAGLLVFFAGSMVVVVLADNLLLLYTGWELTSIASYLLIGNEHEKPHARAAALQALLVTSLGGLAMLAGFVMLGTAAGTYSLHEIVSNPPTGGRVDVAMLLILVGAFTKSAQYPFHFWLPGAMAAPTPVSAFLHSATMVKAGVYLIARLAPAFASDGAWRPVVVVVGITTMVCGGLRAMRQHDLKLLLAHSTVSQLGFLVVLFGVGTPEAATAGCAMLAAHALFKAALFLGVGTLDHQHGTRDIRRLPCVGRADRMLVALMMISAASMAGLPLLFGFVAKEAAFAGLLDAPFEGARWVVAGVVAGSTLTAAYSARLVWGLLGRERDPTMVAQDIVPAPATPGLLLVAPVAVLTVVTLVAGTLPAVADDVIGAASGAVQLRAVDAELAVWHGVNAALVLSAIAIAGGALLFVVRRRIEPAFAVGAAVPPGGRVYAWLLRAVNRAATRVTSIVQNGSLPIYAGVTLLTAAVLAGFVTVTSTSWPGFPGFASTWVHVPVAAAVLGAALAAAVVRRRFVAVLFLGVTGYAMAGLFAVQGAPDLALTQVAIETLSTVLFVLVLRRLPDQFERTSTRQRRIGRLVISLVMGVTVTVVAIVSRAARRTTPVSDEMVDRALPDGHGRNVVNVILVDIRGFDTLGEITVLAAAAIGAVALARVGRRRTDARRRA